MRYLLLFFIYSFLGWVLEVFTVYFSSHKWVNRGFLIGPVCPIYGFGGLFVVLFLSRYRHDLLVLFIMSSVLCSVLEYLTSYFLEKIFKARWWDYSKKPFNINGRIALTTSLAFGVLGTIIALYINPLFLNLISFIPRKIMITLTTILTIVFLIDAALTFNVMFQIKNQLNLILEDNTREISKKVREFLASHSYFSRHILRSFSNFKIPFKKKHH